jgi:nucleoside-diphosphate-sugar epimerase
MAKITVLGARGFIGSRLAMRLRELGHDVFCPDRNADLAGQDLGHVAYCIGLTADFRQRPLDTVEAHVCKLADVIRRCAFESLVYLSSTRVYGASGTGREDTPVAACSADPSDLYNLSKLLGESLCLSATKPVRVARLSNVYGPDFTSENFLTELIRTAVDTGEVLLRSALDSAKDYIALDEVVEVLCWMLTGSCRHGLYNVASGKSVSNAEIAEALAVATGCCVRVEPGAPHIRFPEISVARLRAEFPLACRPVSEALAGLADLYRQTRSRKA